MRMKRDSPPGENTRHGRRKLGRRLLGWFLILSLVPLFASSLIGYLRSRSIIEGLVARYLAGIAEAQAVHVRDQIQEQLLLLEQSARPLRFEAVGNDTDATRAMLSSLLDDQPWLEAVCILDRNGTIRSSAPLPPADLRVWLPTPVDAPERPVEVVPGAVPSEPPLVRLAVPLEGDSVTAAPGYLAALVIIRGGGQFLQIPEHVAGTVESFVLDSNGRPLFVSHPHGHVDYSVALATPLLGGTQGESVRYEDRLGITVIGTIVPVPDSDWLVITEAPVAMALEDLALLRRVSIALAVLFVAVVGLTSLFVAAQIVAPVRRLVEGARKIGGGDLDARVQVAGDDEIGTLGAAFNQMADDLAMTSAEIEKLHRKELERAGQLATVGELASGVAHELKNPVVSISSGLDLVTRRTGDDPTLAPIVTEMNRQLKRIEVAVRDLLAFARPREPSLSPTTSKHLLDRAVTLVQPAADAAGVLLTVDRDSELPVVVDEEMITQVLVNLVVNAVQATDRNGEVRILAREAGDRVVVEVRDEGSGISPDRLAQIFKPFYTTKHRGTGLGLSISRGIAERHGGSITVDSTEGVGTVFYMTLPGFAEPRVQDRDPDERAPSGE